MGNLGSMYRMSPTWKMAFFVILSLVTTQQILSQVDTGSTFYFPLGAGNLWQYKEPPPPDQPYITETKMGLDTSFSGDQTYHSSITKNYGYPDTIGLAFFRQEGNKVYQYLQGPREEILRCDFEKNIGDTVSIFPIPFNDTVVVTVLDSGRTSFFGLSREFRTFYWRWYHTTNYLIEEITDSIGITFSQVEPGYQLALVGAIIDGVRYGVVAHVDKGGRQVPEAFTLLQNYPNPFNPSTTISFVLHTMSKVNVSIWNVLGIKVRDLFKGTLAEGIQAIVWDGKNGSGVSLPSGIYISRLSDGKNIESAKMLLIR
jgi:hypothetical protein